MTRPKASILILIDTGYEDMELMYPKYRLWEAGFEVVVAGPDAHREYLGKHGYPCQSDVAISSVDSGRFAGIICPGGWAPDHLRRLATVKNLVREFHRESKVIAAICHGGWIPISAGVYKGIRVTGSLGIKDDLENAGAIFEDAEVVVDGHFVSSRQPDDCPAFMTAVLKLLALGHPALLASSA